MEQASRSRVVAPPRDIFCVSRRYALAAAATGQLSLGAAWAHREICLRVAMNAHAHKRRAHLAVYYDQARRPARAGDALPRSLGESARAMWAERTRAGEHDFTAEKAAVKFSSWVLRQARSGAQRAGSSRGPRAAQAEDAYDRDEKPDVGSGGAKGSGRSGQQGRDHGGQRSGNSWNNRDWQSAAWKGGSSWSQSQSWGGYKRPAPDAGAPRKPRTPPRPVKVARGGP